MYGRSPGLDDAEPARLALERRADRFSARGGPAGGGSRPAARWTSPRRALASRQRRAKYEIAGPMYSATTPTRTTSSATRPTRSQRIAARRRRRRAGVARGAAGGARAGRGGLTGGGHSRARSPRAAVPPRASGCRVARSGRRERPGERRVGAERLLDAQQLVVLRHAIRARRRAGLDLAAAGGHREVGDRHVLGLARAVRHDRGVAGLARHADRGRASRSACRSG